MKKFNVLMVVLALVTGTQAGAASNTCPDVTGLYEVKSEEVFVTVSPQGTDLTDIQIAIPTRLSYSDELSLRARDPKGQVFGSNFGDYIFDGKTHYFSWDPSADNYFIKYKAGCSAGTTMWVVQEGADNNSDYLRVSTYRENLKMIIDPANRKHLQVINDREVYSTTGKLIYKVQIRRTLERN